METGRTNWTRWAFMLPLFGCVQFIVLTVIAMFLYPGGTRDDATTVGYSFWRNFFSDLGRTRDFMEDPNTASFVLFTIALSVAGFSLIVFFLALPRLFSRSRSPSRLSILGSVVGVLSGLSYIGIASTPWNLYETPHRLLVYLAFCSFLLVVVLYTAAILRNSGYPNLYAYTYLSFAVLLAGYLVLIFAGPDVESDNGVRIQATGQKIIVYAMIVCMLIQAVGALKILRKTDGTATGGD
jgi:hypothetical protein